MINTGIDTFTIKKTIVNKLTEYFYTNNLHSAVLGVSGGIDSTVVAVILYEVKQRLKALKFDFNVYGYSLPTKTTNNQEFFVSILVGNTFCDSFEVIEISDITSKISGFLKHSYEVTDVFRRGNVKSRFRMMYLYDTAKAIGGVVVGTDNYTEKLLGFSTIGGDDTADIMPIQNLWKTEVYRLAEEYFYQYEDAEDYAKMHAIDASIKLTPQDGLGISNSDMDQLGAKNYYEVDNILFNYINGTSIEDLCEKYQDAAYQVVNRYNNNFKLKLPITVERNDFKD